MFALVLEANRNLTWRDMQHIIVKTAKNTSECDPGWRRNAAGNTFNIKFGFGRIDAYAMVMAALNWKNVPEQLNCTLEGTSKDRNIPRGGRLVLTDVLSGSYSLNISTYLHTCLLTCVLTYLPTYLASFLPAYLPSLLHPRLHTFSVSQLLSSTCHLPTYLLTYSVIYLLTYLL